jgi:hypothetical protein
VSSGAALTTLARGSLGLWLLPYCTACLQGTPRCTMHGSGRCQPNLSPIQPRAQPHRGGFLSVALSVPTCGQSGYTGCSGSGESRLLQLRRAATHSHATVPAAVLGATTHVPRPHTPTALDVPQPRRTTVQIEIERADARCRGLRNGLRRKPLRCAAKAFGGPRFAKLLSLNSAKLAKPLIALR